MFCECWKYPAFRLTTVQTQSAKNTGYRTFLDARGRRHDLDHLAVGEDGIGADGPPDRGDASRVLGVSRAGIVPVAGGVVDERDRHGSPPVYRDSTTSVEPFQALLSSGRRIAIIVHLAPV